ncbi:MAG: insulinase family protein [Acidobacteria bacterium]|nr:insulinase family protein [Acidobacteriota bacterium]
MTKRFLFPLGLFLLAAFGTYVPAQVRVAPLDIKQRTISNGLRVVSVRDTSSPTVSIHVWYDVGGKNDPDGRSGFAHMFEHMMFKSTKNMESEMLDRLTEDVGGFNNASTWDDFTNYYEVVPSNHLERLLWAESDRMVNLNVDDANFSSEREVVKEEYRQSVLAQTYGRFYEYITSLSYEVHPYKRGVIGNLDELSAASRDDADRFYRTFYRPDNAYLIVVGDFEQAQFDGWVDKYFGRLQKPAGEIPRVTAVEPERSGEKRFDRFGPNVEFPAVAMTYLGPPAKSVDLPAIRVAEAIMSGGESTRLYLGLVRPGIAQDAYFYIDLRLDRSLLVVSATAAQSRTTEEMEEALLAEIARIQKTRVSAKELQKAKNQLVAQALQSRETHDGKAIAIERAVAYLGDPTAVNFDIAKLQAVTVADVQRVMNKYFQADKRYVINYRNQGGITDGQ